MPKVDKKIHEYRMSGARWICTEIEKSREEQGKI